MKNCLPALLVVFCVSTSIVAQQSINNLKTETEVGTDGSGNASVSQYIFFDRNREGHKLGFSALGRYTKVENSVNREEFGIGPNWHAKRVLLNTYIGGTTDGRLMLATMGIVSLPWGLTFVGISDPKVPLVNRAGQTTTWYRKALVGKGKFWFRWEDLYVHKHGEAFTRIGGEIRVNPSKKVELFGNPFFDNDARRAGFMGGFRVKIL